MKTLTEKTFWVRIYASGPIDIAKQVCREYCLGVGLCVTIEPTTFIYTGGEEAGYVVGLINYPRFPAEPIDIWNKAHDLSVLLLERTAQHSILLMDPAGTRWITKRKEEARGADASACKGGHPHHDYQVSSPIDTVEVCTRCGKKRDC